MNCIRKFFITAKHWQLFLLFCAALGIAEGIGIAASSISPRWALALWPLGLMFLGWIVLWAWSVASFLHSLAPKARWLDLRLFVVAVVYSFIWMVLESILSTTEAEMRVLLLTGFILVFCVYYMLYFLSKSLVLAETGKAPTLLANLLLWYLFCFVPVGIWFIQPRINRLSSGNVSGTGESAEL